MKDSANEYPLLNLEQLLYKESNDMHHRKKEENKFPDQKPSGNLFLHHTNIV